MDDDEFNYFYRYWLGTRCLVDGPSELISESSKGYPIEYFWESHPVLGISNLYKESISEFQSEP